ncbi:MAG: hypothetical protein ACJAZ1_002239 [Yoonia sp.]|jgi:hypothetical protein
MAPSSQHSVYPALLMGICGWVLVPNGQARTLDWDLSLWRHRLCPEFMPKGTVQISVVRFNFAPPWGWL